MCQRVPGQVVMVKCDDTTTVNSPSQQPEKVEVASEDPTASFQVGTLEQLEGIVLSGPFPRTDQVNSQVLWADRPVAIMVARRLGCQMCRKSFLEASKLKMAFEKIGVPLICVVANDTYGQTFIDDVWAGLPLYVDKAAQMQKALEAPKYSKISQCHPVSVTKLIKVLGGCHPTGGGMDDLNEDTKTIGLDLVVTSNGLKYHRYEDSTFSHKAKQLLAAAQDARGF